MALPKTFALKSPYNQKYLTYIADDDADDQGLLKFSSENVNPFTTFEVEDAKCGDGMVHIRCAYNNKYLRRQSPNSYRIAAEGDAPVENQSRWTCTLFKPHSVTTVGDAKGHQLLHVQQGSYATSLPHEPYGYLCLARSRGKLFTVTDLAADSGKNNGNDNNNNGEEKNNDDDNNNNKNGEEKNPDGGKGDGNKDPEPDSTKLGPDETEIMDVKFDTSKAKIVKKTVELSDAIAMNPAKENKEKEVTFEYDKEETATWKVGTSNDDSNSTKTITKIKSEMLPVLVDGNLMFSGDGFRGPYQLGKAMNSTYRVKSTYKVMVPPATQMTITLRATEATLKIPFSYKRRDSNGTVPKHDGMYERASLYDFTYTSVTKDRIPTPK